MVCEEKIMELERRLGRKLSAEEKRKVEEKLHHSEISEYPLEEEPIAC